MGLSGFELTVILVVAVLLFGTGKISGLMGDLAKGIRSFKKTMNEPDEPVVPRPSRAADAPEEPDAAHGSSQSEKL